MLGKLIKNEIVNRGAQVLLLLLGIVAISGVEAILLEVKERTNNPGTFFNTFVILFSVAYGFVMFSSFIGVAFFNVSDFGKRLFKDQGYLTHTLPVKTSSIIIARMICDFGVMIAFAITFPFALSITFRDFSFYKGIIDILDSILKATGSVADKSLLIATLVALFIGIFISMLFTLWMYNGAYALGHMFSKNKRILSVVFFIVIVVIVEVISIVIGNAVYDSNLLNFSVEIRDHSITGNVGALFMLVMASDVIMLISAGIMAAITNWVCKNKLNLE